MSIRVKFLKSDKTVTWDDRLESLLALALENDIPLETDCEQGFCGTCKCRLVSGEVDMETQDGLDDADVEQGLILPCVAVPKTDIVIDA